jgi:hypothetical protein
MNWNAMIYPAVCVLALLYLTVANATGYVPFAGRTSRTSGHTAFLFHK